VVSANAAPRIKHSAAAVSQFFSPLSVQMHVVRCASNKTSVEIKEFVRNKIKTAHDPRSFFYCCLLFNYLNYVNMVPPLPPPQTRRRFFNQTSHAKSNKTKLLCHFCFSALC
jgi:hypothetical protein